MTDLRTVAGALKRAAAADAVRVAATVVLPTVAQGVIKRRPAAMAVAERVDADGRAVRLLHGLRDRYGPGPLLLATRGRPTALILSPPDVRRVLAGAPEPFAPASAEKRAALAHFQPHGVLVSQGEMREERRRFVESVLETGRPTHSGAAAFVRVVAEEVRPLLAHATRTGHLGWNDFQAMWWCVVRRITLGDRARDDKIVTDLLDELRRDANWAFLRPRRGTARDRLHARLRRYADVAPPGTLAHLVRTTPAAEGTDPVGQLPHWLFAFDAAGITTMRALALLSTHAQPARQARAELIGLDLSVPQPLPFLRACLLDAVRLWPTTPMILRETTREVAWDGGTLPEGTTVLIFTPLLHRDGPYADRFAPELWLEDPGGPDDAALVPFSAGPARCPGRELVLLVTSAVLGQLFQHHDYALHDNALEPPLPGTLNPFRLRFAVSRPPAPADSSL